VKRGFTLIEILIVVVILGILAAIIVPQFTNAAQDAGVSSARSQLQTMRSQIELYRVQNNGAVPVGPWADLMDPDGDPDTADGLIRAAPVWPQGFTEVYNAGQLSLDYDGTVDFDGDGTADSGATGW
jgi:general secretion pathway protein G